MSIDKVILITSGEPAGVGPELCLDIVKLYPYNNFIPIIIIDVEIIRLKAKILQKNINFLVYDDFENIWCDYITKPKRLNTHELIILNVKCNDINQINHLNIVNVPYVLSMLDIAINISKNYPNIGIVTAPVHKGIINQTEAIFTGHTEYLAKSFNVNQVVMLLASDKLKVALATTHIPLKDVGKNITQALLESILTIIMNDFDKYFKQKLPKVAVCGLNPHCGEGGVLGDEEIKVISPVITKFQDNNHLVTGPYSADTIFNRYREFDVILAMYHDQGLPVIKFADFFGAINITLGLPILRTSVDHGTAIELTNKGVANSSSLLNAIKFHLQNI